MVLESKNFDIFSDIINVCLYNHEDKIIKKGLLEITQSIDKNMVNIIHRPRSWKSYEYDDMWTILVSFYGECGTYTRSGCITITRSGIECIKKFIKLYLDEEEK